MSSLDLVMDNSDYCILGVSSHVVVQQYKDNITALKYSEQQN